MPGIAHHEFEVVVIIDGRGHVVVVVQELCRGDFAVRDSSDVEGVQEFSESYDKTVQ